MYERESWTMKKAELQRIDAFELWCWRRLLRVPWTVRRSNQSILKEISPEYSLEGLMLKLKLQYFGHLIGRTDSLEKTLMLGKIEGRRRRGWQRITWLDSNTDSIDMNLSKLWEYWWTRKPSMLQSMGLQKVRHDWVTELTQPALYWWTVCPSWRLFRNKRDASFYKMFMVKFGKCYTFLLEMHNAYKHNKFSEKSCNIEISSFF